MVSALESRQESDWVDSWEAALALLDEYLWHEFHSSMVVVILRWSTFAGERKRAEREEKPMTTLPERFERIGFCGRSGLMGRPLAATPGGG